LLRVLAERVVMRLGSTRPRAIDVRIIAATNRDIETESRGGRFREDLFFRLNGISLTIPPLRERPGEVDDLARSFLAAACRLIERGEIPRISREAFDLFHRYSWRGNVRELRNAMEHAAVLCPGETILPEHLPVAITRSPEPGRAPNGASNVTANTGTVPASPVSQAPDRRPDLPTEIKSLERTRILDALECCGGKQGEAARLLGISRRTLISRIEEFGLPRPRKRDAEPDS
jgi:DNA-binding NtrC family response regulator